MKLSQLMLNMCHTFLSSIILCGANNTDYNL
jgi:hypothetical protein